MNWSDINVEQYQELSSIKLEDFDSVFEYKKELMAICYDISADEIEELDVDEYEVKEKTIDFLFTKPSSNNKNKIELDNHMFHFISSFNLLTLQEYLEIEHYLTTNILENYHKVLAIMYRLKEEKNSILFPDALELYTGYAEHRGPIFYKANVEDVYGAIIKYTEWRAMIIDRYSGLYQNDDFKDDAKPLTQEEKKALSPEEIKEMETAIKHEQKVAKWNLELFLKNLTDNDITKCEALLKENVLFVLNWKSASVELNIN